MRRALTVAILIASLGVLPGCSDSPIAPRLASESGQPPAPQPTIPAPVVPQSVAVLAIEQITVTEYPPIPDKDHNGRFIHNYYSYVPRFLIRETSGHSGAELRKIGVASVNSADDGTGESCSMDEFRVQPGGTLDAFFTDEALRRLSYCGPAAVSDTPLDRIRLTVTYQDDNGRSGWVQQEVSVK